MKLKVAVSFLSFSLPIVAQGWVDRTSWSSPPARSRHAMCYDAAHGYVIVAGGLGMAGNTLSDVWTWDGTSWTPRGMLPANAVGATCLALTYDPVANAPTLVIEAGVYPASDLQEFLWNGSQWISQGSLPTTGSITATTFGMAFDQARGQLVLYGTYYTGNPYQTSAGWPNMLVRTGATWASIPLPARPVVYEAGYWLAWDPAAGRIVLSAMDRFHQIYNHHEWSGINWQLRMANAIPSGLGYASEGTPVTDMAHGCVVIYSSFPYPSSTNPIWTLTDAAYRQISTYTAPLGREDSNLAFDSSRGVSVLFGGFNGYSMSDTWEFDLGPAASYSTFGSGCLGSRGVPHIAAQGTSMPRVGGTFTLQANNLPWTGATFLFLGLSNTSYSGTPLPFNLATLGAPNCSVLCSGDQLHVMSTVLGSGSWSWQVPPLPGLTFYNQAFALDPTTNALGLVTSNAGTGIIGL